jgi:cold shock CspA family protein
LKKNASLGTGGFGFIKTAKEDIVPDNKVMVHWREIQLKKI